VSFRASEVAVAFVHQWWMTSNACRCDETHQRVCSRASGAHFGRAAHLAAAHTQNASSECISLSSLSSSSFAEPAWRLSSARIRVCCSARRRWALGRMPQPPSLESRGLPIASLMGPGFRRLRQGHGEQLPALRRAHGTHWTWGALDDVSAADARARLARPDGRSRVARVALILCRAPTPRRPASSDPGSGPWTRHRRLSRGAGGASARSSPPG